jgi:hypothetical protein
LSWGGDGECESWGISLETDGNGHRYDAEHNTFSTLEGLRFQWALPEAAGSPLMLVPLRNSTYRSSEARLALEDAANAHGLASDVHIVQVGVGRLGRLPPAVRTSWLRASGMAVYTLQRYSLHACLPPDSGRHGVRKLKTPHSTHETSPGLTSRKNSRDPIKPRTMQALLRLFDWG